MIQPPRRLIPSERGSPGSLRCTVKGVCPFPGNTWSSGPILLFFRGETEAWEMSEFPGLGAKLGVQHSFFQGTTLVHSGQ